ncbi:MAG: hypothetical protein GY762_10675 [Proteobacteria bacterium]|nr:hypothetical protein [Pseudomonadota bacterium]
MRIIYLCLVIFTIVPLVSVGCFYTVDRSKICEEDAGTDGGYGLACETDEQCDDNPTDENGGATQCLTLDKMVTIEDGPPSEAPDAGSAIDDLLKSLEPALNTCTDMACESDGCPACYQCCKCDVPVSDVMETFDVPPDPSMENIKLDFAACMPAEAVEFLNRIEGCKCS